MQKKALVVILVLFFVHPIKAQISEVGLHLGGSYYLGDVNQTRHFYNPRTSQGLVFRYNFNIRSAIRLNLTNTHIEASDSDFKNEFKQSRDHSFRTQLNEFTAQMEYNFLRCWYEGKDNHKLTSYTALGFGMLYMENGQPSSVLPVLPIGIGGKMHFSKHWSASIEWGLRLTYSDYLDKLENPYNETAPLSSKTRQKTFFKNKDHYSVFGLMVTYRIFTDKHVCPAYGNVY